MKRVLFITMFTVLIIFVLADNIMAQTYKVTVNDLIMENGQKGKPYGSSSFFIRDDNFGQVCLVYFSDGIRMATTARSKISTSPFLMLKENWPGESLKNVFLAADILLRITPAGNGRVRVTGIINREIRDNPGDPARMNAYIDELDFVLSCDEKKSFEMSSNYNGNSIFIEISVCPADEQQPLAEAPPQLQPSQLIQITAQYNLMNLETGNYELRDKKCDIGLGVDSESKGSCLFSKMYYLPNGDSLLYTFMCDLTNPVQEDNQHTSFSIEISHVYSLNPVEDKNENSLESDQTTVVMFKKEISVTKDNRTEIEISGDPDSPLPFEMKEYLVLTYDFSHKQGSEKK